MNDAGVPVRLTCSLTHLVSLIFPQPERASVSSTRPLCLLKIPFPQSPQTDLQVLAGCPQQSSRAAVFPPPRYHFISHRQSGTRTYPPLLEQSTQNRKQAQLDRIGNLIITVSNSCIISPPGLGRLWCARKTSANMFIPPPSLLYFTSTTTGRRRGIGSTVMAQEPLTPFGNALAGALGGEHQFLHSFAHFLLW